LLSQGQDLYRAGQYYQARQHWQGALQVFTATDQTYNRALALTYLALAHKSLGDYGAANGAIAIALELALELAQALENRDLGQTGLAATKPRETELTLLAQVWNSQGSIQLAAGQTELALESWGKAEDLYREAGDVEGEIGTNLNQLQALQGLGFFHQAQRRAQTLSQTLVTLPDSSLKVLALHNFGDLLQTTGSLQGAEVQLQKALALAKALENSHHQSRIWNSLGNLYRQTQAQDPSLALHAYDRAIQLGTTPALKLEPQLNQLSLLIEEGQTAAIVTRLPEIATQLEDLPLSRSGIHIRVNWASQLLRLLPGVSQAIVPQPTAPTAEGNQIQAPDSPPSPPSPLENFANPTTIASVLVGAIHQAQQLKDPRAEAFALGTLAHLYEQSQQWPAAERLTRQAIALALQANADDIAYRWQWQLGRVAQKSGADRTVALGAYEAALASLEKVRGDLLVTNPEFQFSFRDSVEPVYREMVSLLIHPQASPAELQQARQVIEDLQVAELEDFFQSACIDRQATAVDQLDPTAAVIYPILLDDRLAVISSIPGQPLQHHTIVLGKAEVEATLGQLLQSLNPAFDDQYRFNLSQTVHGWLIGPLKPQLTATETETLVFVLDGFFRSIPMGVLYDGQDYLVEQYNLALAPGLQLVDPQMLDREQLRVLALGLSQSRQGFRALPGVQVELAEIAQLFPSQILLDESFTTGNMAQAMTQESFAILHMATHGQFSSNLEETFLLSWDQTIAVTEFQRMVRSRALVAAQAIELLVLSACQTAAGDKQAALGLAGFAVQSGARSTVATLWSVSDRSTTLLMTAFYHNVLAHPHLSRSAALRQAQLSLLKQDPYQHPFYWAPFVLVGNWL
jgi:CHAT domain-containing protein